MKNYPEYSEKFINVLKYLSNLLDKRITMKLHLFLTFIFLTFVNYPKCEQGQILDFSDFETRKFHAFVIQLQP